MVTRTEAELRELYEQACSSVEEVCSQLAEDDWDRPTDLPGWSVKDNLSHLADFEAHALGRAAPEGIDVSGYDYLKDDFARANERGVEWRRSRPGGAVLAEFREVTSLRVKQLAELDDWEEPLAAPVATAPHSRFVPIRILDLFVHEQDIRRATGRPGHLDGGVARFVFERGAFNGMPRIVATEAKAPDGAVIVFDVGAPGERFAVRVEDGRGSVVPEPDAVTAVIACDFETFLLLFGGRAAPDALADRIALSGDEALARSVLEHMTVVP